jgi:hypothetical protein
MHDEKEIDNLLHEGEKKVWIASVFSAVAIGGATQKVVYVKGVNHYASEGTQWDVVALDTGDHHIILTSAFEEPVEDQERIDRYQREAQARATRLLADHLSKLFRDSELKEALRFATVAEGLIT